MNIYSTNRLTLLLSTWIKSPKHWAAIQGIYTFKSGLLAWTAQNLMQQQVPTIWIPRKMPNDPAWLALMAEASSSVWLFDEWTGATRWASDGLTFSHGAFAIPGGIQQPNGSWPCQATDSLAMVTLTPIGRDSDLVRWDWHSSDGISAYGWLPRGPWPAPVLPASIAAWDFGFGAEAIAYPAPVPDAQCPLADPWGNPVYVTGISSPPVVA